MKYDFDTLHDRRNTGSLKWDVEENELPMWVADMDFQAAPEICRALERKMKLGIFGYTDVTEEWYQAIIGWWKRRHQFAIQKEWLVFCTGIIPAISCAVKRMTNVGDNVVVQTPVYDIFFNSIENHGRHLLENKLKYNGTQYEMDFEDLEKKLAHPLTTMMILCNPQNPAGKIWSKEELERIGELCKKHNVTVVSDEIHCDITDPGCEYVPFASVSDTCRENSITCIAATKAFNLAGLQTAAVMIPNERIRNMMVRGLNSDEVAEPNVFAVDAVVAAFNEGEAWLDELREYLYENKKGVLEFLKKEIPEITVAASNATYLLWLDCSKITSEVANLCGFIRRETGLYLTKGSQYRGDGTNFIRMNIACPRARLEEGLKRLKTGVARYKEHEGNV